MKKLLLTVLIIPLFGFVLHKYYVCLTDIEYSKEKKSVQIVMNVFIDDIEVALNKTYKIDAQLTTKKEVESIDDYFFKYLKEHFHIRINDQEKHYTFIGKEYDGDLVFFYLEVEDIPKFNSISVENSMLFQYFEEQQNLIKVTANGNRKSLFFNKKKHKGLLKF